VILVYLNPLEKSAKAEDVYRLSRRWNKLSVSFRKAWMNHREWESELTEPVEEFL
jgi:hypothetical protein